MTRMFSPRTEKTTQWSRSRIGPKARNRRSGFFPYEGLDGAEIDPMLGEIGPALGLAPFVHSI